MPRETQLIASGIAQANTGQTTIIDVPRSARTGMFYLSVVAATGNTPLTDFKFRYVVPKITAAPVVATTVAGNGSTNEVQTVTLTGGPTNGTWTLSWGGVSSNINVTTRTIGSTADAAEVQRALIDALRNNATYDGNDIVVTRAGAGTAGSPYVYTLTFSGGTVDLTNVDAVTVSGSGLYTHAAQTAYDFAGWDGITQIAGTTAGEVVIIVGPDESDTTDDTGAIYQVQSVLPKRLAAVLTFDRTTGDETYTYSLYADYI